MNFMLYILLFILKMWFYMFIFYILTVLLALVSVRFFVLIYRWLNEPERIQEIQDDFDYVFYIFYNLGFVICLTLQLLQYIFFDTSIKKYTLGAIDKIIKISKSVVGIKE